MSAANGKWVQSRLVRHRECIDVVRHHDPVIVNEGPVILQKYGRQQRHGYARHDIRGWPTMQNVYRDKRNGSKRERERDGASTAS